MYMQGLANFIDDFLGGLILISFAMVIGGIVWSGFVLKCWGGEKTDSRLTRRSAKIIRYSAIGLLVMQGLKLLIKGLVLFGVLGELPILDYISTVQFKAGFIRLILAIVVVHQSSALIENPSCHKTWLRLTVVAIPLVLAGAWLVHAVGRFDDRFILMGLTVLHQLAAAVWFGGVAQLVSLWQLSRSYQTAKDFCDLQN
jgi:copper resistance protein D